MTINIPRQLDYSVVIRTLGTSGEKYHSLLKSVKSQTVQPREVVVVMARGYTLPPFHIENERVVWTRKGMINQRQVGFEESKSPYLLVLDDDISFENDFVEKMFRQMQSTGADCIFPVTGVGGAKVGCKKHEASCWAQSVTRRAKTSIILE